MDDNICLWILDFFLRQPIHDSVIQLALSDLPLPPDSSLPLRLKKSLLLRTLKSHLSHASISETLLDHLESLEAIDSLLGHPVSASMKDAYRAVALECTLPYLHVGVEEGEAMYSAAVHRIWRGRIPGMEAKSQLITADLRSWNPRFEVALSDETERQTLMSIDGRADAFRSLRAYLDEAYVKLGPSFLETAALSTSAPPPFRESAAAAAAAATAATSHERNGEAPEVGDYPKDAAGPNAVAPCNIPPSVATNSKNEKIKMAVPCKAKQAPLHRRTGGGIKITCTEESGGGTSHNSHDSLPTPMVDKVQEALKSSSLELRAAVQDPLPESVKVAASLVPDGAETAPNPLQQDQVGKDVRAPDPSLDGSATDAAPAMQGDCQAQPCGHEDVLPGRSLMEKNSSAQTYQWDDSPEGTSAQNERPRLHSPKRLAVSPLRTAEPPKASKRRRRRGWSLQEEETLRNGVARFGQGNWKLIRDCYSDIFEDRTEVDLKDKWRNMMR